MNQSELVTRDQRLASQNAKWEGHRVWRCQRPDVSNLTPHLLQSDHEIHLWLVNLNQDAGREEQLREELSCEELQRAKRLQFDSARRRFVVRRSVLRHILASYLSVTPGTLQFSMGADGKPSIPKHFNCFDVKFNCSHSGDLALIAVACGCEVGVDLEQHRPFPEWLDLARRYFSKHESVQLLKVPSGARSAAFFDCWTRKEAFVKAVGLGLSFPLNAFTVSLAADQPAALLEVEGDPTAANHWSMVALDLGLDYSGAVVYEGRNLNIRYFRWPGL